MSDTNLTKAVDVFLELIATRGWDHVSVVDVADEAEISLSELRLLVSGKMGLVEAFAARVDAAVLSELDADVSDEMPRERLMDVLLTRLDVLVAHKAALRALLDAARKDLSLAAQLNKVALVSMTWMAQGAGIDTSGMRGAARVQGISVLFARVLRVWVNDDDAMAKTMVKLDKELRTGERNMRRLDRVAGMMRPLMSGTRGFGQMRRRRSPEDILNEADEAPLA